jgi:endonuclease YncB( thermonuclease family)
MPAMTVTRCFLAILGIVLLLLAVLASLVAAPAPTPRALTFPPESGTWLVLPREAIDGDTVRVYLLVETTVRLAGIQAPETRGETAERGLRAKAFLAARLPTRPVALEISGREKFGRLLGVLRDEEGRDLGQVLVDGGHAVKWDGRGRRPD